MSKSIRSIILEIEKIREIPFLSGEFSESLRESILSLEEMEETQNETSGMVWEKVSFNMALLDSTDRSYVNRDNILERLVRGLAQKIAAKTIFTEEKDFARMEEKLASYIYVGRKKI